MTLALLAPCKMMHCHPKRSQNHVCTVDSCGFNHTNWTHILSITLLWVKRIMHTYTINKHKCRRYLQEPRRLWAWPPPVPARRGHCRTRLPGRTWCRCCHRILDREHDWSCLYMQIKAHANTTPQLRKWTTGRVMHVFVLVFTWCKDTIRSSGVQRSVSGDRAHRQNRHTDDEIRHQQHCYSLIKTTLTHNKTWNTRQHRVWVSEILV